MRRTGDEASGWRSPAGLAFGLMVIIAVAGLLPQVIDRGTPPLTPPDLVEVDVAVYGGTAAGVIAAVSAAQAGSRVVLLESGARIGGMVASGLGHTDAARKDLVGGLTLEFHRRVGQAYELRRFGQAVSWYHEPHVAEAVFMAMLDEAGVQVLFEQPLDRAAGVTMEGPRIVEIRTFAGTTVRAGVFIDATYEGDLMAAAGVRYAVGREPVSAYGEPLAGVGVVQPAVAGEDKIPGLDAASGQPIRGVSGAALEAPGSGDNRIQPYTFRLCVTDVAANRRPFAAPSGYRADQFAIVRRAVETWTRRFGSAPALTSLLVIADLPNGKADLNAAGMFSTNLIGGSYDWPDADDTTRDALWQEHRAYVAGVLYFLSTDPSVPDELRSEVGRWGLCADEFTETGNWPPQLYVREARRLLGEVVLTQADLQEALTKPDSIGVGAYRIDGHTLRRVVDANGFVRGEGDLKGDVSPYQIPLRILLPNESEAVNLVVPVAVSASHVAWASLRMEPNFMTMGEAAGVVAALAADRSLDVQGVPYGDVAAVLETRGAILELPAP